MKNARKQRNCKICGAPDWLAEAFVYRYHIEHLTYLQLIELFEQYGLHLNIYNCSVHLHRHVQQSDIEEAEKLKAKWTEIDAEIAEQD